MFWSMVCLPGCAAQVISVGGGREGESGHVTPNDAVKPGDLVFVKDPYGIGEKGREKTAQDTLSFFGMGGFPVYGLRVFRDCGGVC